MADEIEGSEAQQKGFAASFVVVSDNDLHFYKYDELYRKVVGELGTSACPRGALGDVIAAAPLTKTA